MNVHGKKTKVKGLKMKKSDVKSVQKIKLNAPKRLARNKILGNIQVLIKV